MKAIATLAIIGIMTGHIGQEFPQPPREDSVELAKNQVIITCVEQHETDGYVWYTVYGINSDGQYVVLADDVCEEWYTEEEWIITVGTIVNTESNGQYYTDITLAEEGDKDNG